MLIRKADIKDIPNIIEMAIDLWNSHNQEELSKEFINFIKNPKSVVYLAIKNNFLVAFAYCKLRFDYVEGTSSSPVGYLEGIYVKKEFRKSGLALALLQECEHWAKEQGANEFASDCELTNKESLDFHLKVGFEEANRIICFVKKL